MDQAPGQQRTLHVLTFQNTTEPPACTGGYTCICPHCEHEKTKLVTRGRRPRRPIPLKRAA